MELTDLSLLAASVQKRYQECFIPKDCHLPENFKEHFKKFNYNDLIEYFEYSLVVHASSSLNIYIPNQWIYIAYFFVDYYRMIKAYKEKVSSLMSKEDIKACANNEEKARNILFRYNGDDKEFLIKFLSDYSWWAGGKTLDRNDYYVSPILSLAGLVNASQSYIADICKNLAESELAYNILDESFSSGLGILSSNKSANDTLQLIYYGAPGTGKSFTIDKATNENNSVRTTFHPDSDYASFVGAYKPTMENVPVYATYQTKEGSYGEYLTKTDKHPGTEKKIVYKYVPQAFLKAYVEAWKRYAAGEDDSYYLVIEEINRGNCAQIFGDLFQLLDRNNMGCSSYAISADEDIAQFLREDDKGFGKLTEGQKEAISKFRLKKDSGVEEHIGPEILNGSKLLLPPNLRIWATMNTSDQSLFPIDSAFKRRWNWEYMPIEYDPTDKNTGERLAWKFEVRGKMYYWGKFLDYINPKILKLTMSEDKQMGYFFAKPDKRGTDGRLDVISEKVFVNKVLFYLWTDVFKDYDLTEKPFVYETTTAEGKSIKKSYRFTDFFPIEGNQKLIDFVRGMGLKVEDDGEQTPEQPSDENPTNIGNYVVNGTPVRFQNAVGAEAIKAYMSIYPEKTANEVVEDWKGLGQIVSYFVQTEAEHQARTDSRKDYVITIDCKGENIYVSKEGWGDNRPNGSIYALLNMVNAIKQKGWPIEIKGVE